jgi:hypothetical protein
MSPRNSEHGSGACLGPPARRPLAVVCYRAGMNMRRAVVLSLTLLLGTVIAAQAAEPICPAPVPSGSFGFDECYLIYVPPTPTPLAPVSAPIRPKATPPATDTE